MSLLFYIFIVVGAFLLPKEKKYSYFILLFMWIMFGWSNGNADYNSYEFSYQNMRNIGSSVDLTFGIKLLFQCTKLFGLDYQHFLIIASVPFLILLYKGICGLTRHVNIVLALYLLFPFYLDVTQVKNFFVTCLIVYSIPFLLETSSGGTIKYILVVLVATLIQYSAIIYTLFPFVLLVKKEKHIIEGVLLANLVLIASRSTDLFFNILSRFLPAPWIKERLFQLTNVSTLTLLQRYYRILIIFFLGYISCTYLYKIEKENMLHLRYRINDAINIRKINTFLLVVLSLILYSGEAYRVQQDILIVIYCAVARLYNYNVKHRAKTVGIKLVCYIVIISIAFLLVLRYNFNTVVLPFFVNNLLLGF